MPREKKPTLKRRKDGRYRCKYHDISFYGSTPEEAFAKRDEYKQLERTGFHRASVSEYALPWLKRSYPSVSDSTYTGLAIHLQHLVDIIGNKRISDIVPSDLKEVYSFYYKGLSNSYIKGAKQLYCALFDSALADGLISFNPARDKSAKPHKGSEPKKRILTYQQRAWIETLCQDHRMYPAVMTMLYAGLRPQECKALNMDDVDFENDTITVRRSVHVKGTKYAISGELKTEWSNRTVPLFTPLKRALLGRKGMLITGVNGELTIQAWKCAWESYLSCMETAINGVNRRWKAKAENWIDFAITPYTLRHAYCQFLRDSGVEINVARRWMGHADAKMILKVYDSVSPDREQNEREKVVKKLNRVQNGGQE